MSSAPTPVGRENWSYFPNTQLRIKVYDLPRFVTQKTKPHRENGCLSDTNGDLLQWTSLWKSWFYIVVT